MLLRSAAHQRDLGIVYLRDQALSSSASITNDHAGPGQAHIVDPRTGELIVAKRFAAVLAPTATEAEVLSTALVVAPELKERLASRYPATRSWLLSR